MINPCLCVLCNGVIDPEEVTCTYCDEFLSVDELVKIAAMVRRFERDEITQKHLVFFLAAMRDIRDANYLCELYLPDLEGGKPK